MLDMKQHRATNQAKATTKRDTLPSGQEKKRKGSKKGKRDRRDEDSSSDSG